MYFTVAVPSDLGSAGLKRGLAFCFATFSNLKEINHEIETHQNLRCSRLVGSFRWSPRCGERLLWQYRMLPQDVGLLPVSGAR